LVEKEKAEAAVKKVNHAEIVKNSARALPSKKGLRVDDLYRTLEEDQKKHAEKLMAITG
jgi:hypothetical protein